MSETFDKLKALLDQQGNLSDADIQTAITAHGPLSGDEHAKLDAERHERERTKGRKITMDEYLAASKILDSAPEGSDDYKKALDIVETYERGG
jgi:hypothetical protein